MLRQLLLTLSPLSDDRQQRQGQRDAQGRRGSAQQLTAVHGTPPVGFHHRSFARDTSSVLVCGADVCAAAAAAGAAALIACNVTKASCSHQRPAHSGDSDECVFRARMCVWVCVCTHVHWNVSNSLES